jgi:flagellar basal body-associated protein FliL
MSSKLLIIVAAVVFILVAGIGGFLFIGTSLAGGAFLPVPERVVNLSGEGPYSVLQVTIKLEFEAREGYHGEGGHGGNPIQEELDLELTGRLTPIEDGLTILVAGKTGTDLVSTAGKNQLKEDIAEMVGELVEPHVIAVYFNSFFMQ